MRLYNARHEMNCIICKLHHKGDYIKPSSSPINPAIMSTMNYMHSVPARTT